MPISYFSQISPPFVFSLICVTVWLRKYRSRDICFWETIKSTKMSSYVGVVVSDPELHSQFTQVELRTLKSKVRLSTSHLFLLIFMSNRIFTWVHLYSLIRIKRSWIVSPLETYLLFSPSSTPLVAPLMPMRSNLYWTSLIPMLIKKSISRLFSGW